MFDTAAVKKNEFELVNIITEDDAKEIQKSLGWPDDFIDARILEELGLTNKYDYYADGTHSLAEPLAAFIYNVLFEVHSKEYSTLYPSKYKKIVALLQNLEKTKKLLSDNWLRELIKTDLIPPQEFERFERISDRFIDKLEYSITDIHKFRKKRLKVNDPRRVSAYYRYMTKVSEFYTELTGAKFEANFKRDEQEEVWIESAEGVKFATCFHNILNRVLAKNRCTSYKSSNLRRVCSQIRQNLGEIKNQ